MFFGSGHAVNSIFLFESTNLLKSEYFLNFSVELKSSKRPAVSLETKRLVKTNFLNSVSHPA